MADVLASHLRTAGQIQPGTVTLTGCLLVFLSLTEQMQEKLFNPLRPPTLTVNNCILSRVLVSYHFQSKQRLFP
jgi:hypothetical protein